MKTNKIMTSGLAGAVVIALIITSISIMYGQNLDKWSKWFEKTISNEEKTELKSMSEWEREKYIDKLKLEKNSVNKNKWNWKRWGHWKKWNKGGSIVDMISDIEKEDVSDIEIDLLEKQYEEEMMANELYMSFYKMYGIETFKNIADSESKHMEAVKVLLDRYDIDTPTDYDHIKSLYEELKAKWALSLHDALEVWISIEKVDIDDIITAIKSSDNDDIKTVLVNIWGASYNHMRGFVKALDNNSLTTYIDYSDYINEDDINTKWSIKFKLAEKLEKEGVELPEGSYRWGY